MRIALLFVLLLSLCSCTNARPHSVKCEPMTEFVCTAECKTKDGNYEFSLTVHPDGQMQAAVTKPDSLQGVVFDSDGIEYKMDANGLQDTLPSSLLPPHSPVRLLFDSLQSFLFTGSETLTATAEDTFSTQKNIGNLAVQAFFNKDGLIQSIHCPLFATDYYFTYNK